MLQAYVCIHVMYTYHVYILCIHIMYTLYVYILCIYSACTMYMLHVYIYIDIDLCHCRISHQQTHSPHVGQKKGPLSPPVFQDIHGH